MIESVHVTGYWNWGAVLLNITDIRYPVDWRLQKSFKTEK